MQSHHNNVPWDGIWIDMSEVSSFCVGSCGTGNLSLNPVHPSFGLPGEPGKSTANYLAWRRSLRAPCLPLRLSDRSADFATITSRKCRLRLSRRLQPHQCNRSRNRHLAGSATSFLRRRSIATKHRYHALLLKQRHAGCEERQPAPIRHQQHQRRSRRTRRKPERHACGRRRGV